MTEELKPCPFCRSKAMLYETQPIMGDEDSVPCSVEVYCTVCLAGTRKVTIHDYPKEPYIKAAIQAWNRRA